MSILARLKYWLQSPKGIAYDELALVAFMVSSAGAFAAVSVPWEAVLKSSGERVVDQLALLEQANSQFYQRYRMWPHEMTDGSPNHNVSVLMTNEVMRFPYSQMRAYSNALDSSKFSLRGAKEDLSLYHSFGDGGRIVQLPKVDDKGSEYLEIIFENVPVGDARKVDSLVDGSFTPEDGRLTMQMSGDNVNLHYRANRL